MSSIRSPNTSRWTIINTEKEKKVYNIYSDVSVSLVKGSVVKSVQEKGIRKHSMGSATKKKSNVF